MKTLAEIAAVLNLSAPADAQRKISGIAALEDAGASDISFLTADSYLAKFKLTKAAAVIVNKKVKLPPNSRPVILIVDDADLAVGKVLELFAPPIPRPSVGIDTNAIIAPDATIADDAAIGPRVVIGHRTRIGRGTILHAGVIISDDCVVGDQCEIFHNVVIRERITLGNRVAIHAGSIIGSDGFGYRWDGAKHAKIPQIGTVIIEDDVEIGSCVCVDRAKTGATKIGHGTKIDNLVQVAHNCIIGPHCVIVGQVGLAGSVTLGARVMLGGQTAVRDHITMSDDSIAAARSGVTEDVDAKMVVSGTPALPHRQTLREQAALRRLPDLVAQVRKLQDEIDQLKREN
jgi:UDP-3-O-[3-hydroxymyristoyl] glucosamine N-acyltransferase